MPATIGKRPVRIRTDVMREEIPLPLSKKLMKKLETNRDFKTHTVSVFGSQKELQLLLGIMLFLWVREPEWTRFKKEI